MMERFKDYSYMAIPAGLLEFWISKLYPQAFKFMVCLYKRCCFFGKKRLKISTFELSKMCCVSKPTVETMRDHAMNYGAVIITKEYDILGRPSATYYELVFPDGCEIPSWIQ